jgi:hypothetical protein
LSFQSLWQGWWRSPIVMCSHSKIGDCLKLRRCPERCRTQPSEFSIRQGGAPEWDNKKVKTSWVNCSQSWMANWTKNKWMKEIWWLRRWGMHFRD